MHTPPPLAPNDVVVDRWDLNHVLWTLTHLAEPAHPHERADLQAAVNRLCAALELRRPTGAEAVAPAA